MSGPFDTTRADRQRLAREASRQRDIEKLAEARARDGVPPEEEQGEE